MMDTLIKKYIEPARGQWAQLCERRLADDEAVAGRVAAIVQRVKEDGDEALRSLAKEKIGRAHV